MKKLVLSLAVLAGMTMVACGSSENKAEEADSTAVEAQEEVVEAAPADSLAADSLAAKAE